MNTYEVELGRSDMGGSKFKSPAASIEEASLLTREYIERNNLGAGCNSHTPHFTGGDLWQAGRKVGRISYNGRAWGLDKNEIPLSREAV